MCGICGTTRDADGRAVAAMNGAMRHRGPDDEGNYRDPEAGAALGARRLSIIDVQGGHQPLSNEDGSVWAALNGEIYNHPALQRRLKKHGHRLASGTDTEVLVHLYEDFGDQLVHALEGMFAFAIWDVRRGRLLLGRDRFGEKPLFYVKRDGGVTFASELTALLTALPTTPQLDPSAVDDYFVYGYVPGPGSILRGVRQLPPGSLLSWERSTGATEVRSYWEPPMFASSPVESTDELVAELEALLTNSVRSRMISDVPLGVFLSGGVDSTLIAALAARVSSEPIKTFTVAYDVGDVNENEPARLAAAEVGAEHHELVLSQAELAGRVPDLYRRLDQPIADQALVAMHAVAEFARRDVTVAVGGEGADELFAGYPRYRWLARAERLGRVVPEPVAQRGARALRSAAGGRRAARVADVLAPQPTLERHLDWVTAGRRQLRMAIYGPQLSSYALDANGRLVAGLGERLAGAGTASVIGRHMALDQRHWLPDDVLAKADRAGMLASLEIRTPFLHREVAELAAAVSPEKHASHGGKMLLRALLRRALPTAARRPKAGFRVPMSDWLRGPLAGVLERQVECGALCEEGWFDRHCLSQLAREHIDGSHDHSQALWPILSLGLWLDSLRGLDGR
jgi:asparagine synthase (glutamine-hydrolysing)